MKNFYVVTAAVFAMFFALGMPDGAFGVAWPGMRYEMGLPLGRATTIIVVHSIFYSLASAQTGRLAAFFRVEKISGAGFLLLLAGMMGFSFAPNFEWLAVVTGFLGAGMGLLDAGANAFAAKKFSARLMNHMHCFWAMGGAVSPMIMRQMVISYDWRWGYRAIFALQAVIAVFVLITIVRGLWIVSAAERVDEKTISPVGIFLTAQRFQVVQLLIFSLYTSFEYAVTFWTVSVLMERPGMTFEAAGFFPAVYLGFLMAGRFIFGFATDKLTGTHVIRIGLALSVGGLFVLLFSNNITGIALVGFGFAPVFPCLMNETKRRFKPELLSKLVGLQIAAAGAGVAISAIFMGQLLEISHEALFPTVIFCVGVAFLMNEYIEINLRKAVCRGK